MQISDILKTEGGAKALKAKLKSLSEREKESDNYKKIWSATCAAVDRYNLDKMAKNQSDSIDE